ncbi:MAG: DNA-binding NtrC family response regulator [Marivirga sp.]|jgi:DNA-binding NtrC family response regulator
MKNIPNIKTFVVDDDPFFLNVMEQVLNNLGIEDVTTFSNGFTLENNLHQKPEVIFLDYNLEETTGYEVLKKVKRYDPDVYVVLISAQGEIKPAVDTLKHGAFDYIQKSSNTENQVEQVLNKILEVKDTLEKSKPTLLKRLFQF